MRYRIMLILTLLLLFVGSAAAAFDPTTFERGSEVPSVVITTADYQQACGFFNWRGANDADFNTYVVRLTSNSTEFNNVDINTRNSWYSACSIQPGEWVKAVVYRVDGNADGYFLNLNPDANATVFPGTMTQGGIYMFYNMLVALGGLVGLAILGIVFVIVFKRLGIGNPLNK